MSELYELIAFYRLEPRGPYRDDLRLGLQTLQLLNAKRTRRDPPVRMEDVLLGAVLARSREGSDEMTPEEMDSYARGLAEQTGGRVVEQGEE